MDSIVTTEDTIAAIASAISIGKGGVAIIRVSGKDSINSCKKIVQTKSKYAWKSHRVFHGFIKENKQKNDWQYYNCRARHKLAPIGRILTRHKKE